MRRLPQTQGNNTFAGLQGHNCISLTTFRKSGKPVSTPVRFVVECDKLYVMIQVKTGKIKRIRRNPNVQLTPCTMRDKVVGQTIKAGARSLPAGEETVAKRTLGGNVGLLMGIGKLLSRFGGRSGENMYLVVGPIKEEG